MTPISTSPSIIRRTARLAYDLLAFTALASAPAGAVYTYLQYASPDAPTTARHAGDLVTLGERALEAKQDELELQRGILAALNKILPEQERARINIERLVHLNERRLAEVVELQAERRRQKEREQRPKLAASTAPATNAAPAAVSSGDKKSDRRPVEQKQPARTPNQIAEEIWRELTVQ